ncbi:MAG: hypothetical protein Q8P20_01930 [bacterium]|nr:hypothetical protein [bacterium]
MALIKPINPSEIDNKKILDPNNPLDNKVEDIFEHETADVEISEPSIEQPIEKVESPVERETQLETVEIKPEDSSKEDEISQMQATPPPAQATDDAAPQKSMELIKIENIISEHLDELFLQMTPQQQMTFKQKGEETAKKIDILLKETKVKVKEIVALIKEWLKLIPGINKFFLEQEAKIKTDRLLNLKEQKNKQ